ncbi:MAG TPA: DEAD/DEAH box helicase [Deltaproteobacteria bacterium]|nr:DEAD/DEAH box helicase [Deltaproteobacteria bacterium]
MVRHLERGDTDVGMVIPSEPTPRDENPVVLVRWIRQGRQEAVPAHALGSGFQAGWQVQDVPRSRTRKSLGTGEVVLIRTMGGRDQVLVQLDEDCSLRWIPFENLKRIRGVHERFLKGMVGQPGHAERFRLKTLAYALERWNANTGALSHLDIDPLPHQIHLVHHILASGNLNWLIADDVGLGKTIETGMLISALRQRGQCRRALLITPAGVTRQWQDELTNKFKMDDFEIYGRDFEVHEPSRWRLHDFVIASMDRLKSEVHLEKLRASGTTWDLIVFDEAHRLTRRQWGQKLDSSERFKLAAALRASTDSIILLTGTPHQGRNDQFTALLEILRPELADALTRIDIEPEILSEMVYRNRKIDVTDAQGNFIFHGKTTLAVELDVSEEEIAFDRALQRYVRAGYSAADAGGRQTMAIGFVMTVYRKLASSSIAAILRALEGRLARLLAQETAGAFEYDPDEAAEDDARYAGEGDESHAAAVAATTSPFFEEEFDLLRELVSKARALYRSDRKLSCFLEEVLPKALEKNRTGKVLIFTEYRATQERLAEALRDAYGEGTVAIINGSQSIDEKLSAIDAFEADADFLISTEAGGEGINLHHQCHVMVNYDLPWNPMRLVQRVGRLYRYGQADRVIVLNLNAPQTVDGKIVEMMYERLDTIVREMAPVSGEYSDRLHDEIVGEIAALADLEEIIERALTRRVDRPQDRIDDALRKAADAKVLQDGILARAQGFDPNATAGELAVGSDHLHSFAFAMLGQLGVEILDSTHDGRVMEIRLPEKIADEIGSTRTRIRVATERKFTRGAASAEMLDFTHPLMRKMIETARSHEFGGLTGVSPSLPYSAAFPMLLRWQNDQGRVTREELDVFVVPHPDASNGIPPVQRNPDEFSDWLRQAAGDGEPARQDLNRKTALESARQQAQIRLAELASAQLHPQHVRIIGAGWM